MRKFRSENMPSLKIFTRWPDVYKENLNLDDSFSNNFPKATYKQLLGSIEKVPHLPQEVIALLNE